MRRREFISRSAGLVGLMAAGPVLSQVRPCPPGTLSASGGTSVQVSCGTGDLPSWVPQPGTFANISLNLPSSTGVYPCPAGGCVYVGSDPQGFLTWTSGIYAPELGTMGSYVKFGGGHKGYAGNEVYRFDVATRLWSRMGNPSPYSDAAGNIDQYGAFPDGKPAAPHNYQTMGIRFASSGGGTYGSLIQATVPACDENGSLRSGAWWQFDFAQQTWKRFIDSTGVDAGSYPHKLMAQEPTTGHFWWLGGGNTSKITRVTQTGVITAYAVEFYTQTYSSPAVVPGSRILAVNGWFETGQHELKLIDLALLEKGGTAATAIRRATVSGTPANGDSGLQWCPDRGAFAAMNSEEPTRIYWLTPPTDLWSGTWKWSVETLAPAGGASAYMITDGSSYTGSFNRFVWCPPIKSFLWATGRNNPVQA